MPRDKNQLQTHSPVSSNEAIEHLRKAVASGKHWYIALLEAIGLWTAAEETHNGRHYKYLIGGEAFDWLLLAERLSEVANRLVPEQELVDLIFFGKPPIELSREDFKNLIGSGKYSAYLNYLYGVTVEESLILAVEEEIRKEQQAIGGRPNERTLEEAYPRIYGADRPTLLKRFRAENHYPQRASISLPELREFTYWLFKYRLNQCDKAKLASDTKKGLEHWQRQRLAKGLVIESLEEEPQAVIEL